MRTLASRLLLAALVVAVVFAVARLGEGGGDPSDAVHFSRLRVDRLEHAAFVVGRAGARVVIEHTGSVAPGAEPDGRVALAAYGWIVRRDTPDGDDSAAVVWRPDVRVRPSRGSVVALRDTVALAPGVYDAYFTSFGDPDAPRPAPPSGAMGRLRHALGGGGRAWVGESDRWRFSVRGATEADRAATERHDAPPDPDGDAVAHAQPARAGEASVRWLRVEAPSRVRLRGVTEVRAGGVRDSLDLLHVERGRTVWAATARVGAWAGGARRNRAYDTTLVLAPGIYRLRASADRAHGPHGWDANPPWVPSAWGLRLTADPGAALAQIPEPTADGLPEIARIDCAGPDRDLRARFALTDTVVAVVEAVGELSSERDRYDVGTLEREPDGGGPATTLWAMPYGETTHAGGADRNRRGADVLVLAPGAYALRYTTDGSHDCTDDFPGGAPDEPFWGIRLGAVSPGFTPAAVRRDAPGGDGPADALASPRPTPTGAVLVRLAGLGSDVDLAAPLALDAPTELRIVALGELFPSQRLDWGSIEDADGHTVWEMTRANTTPGGGAPQNRRFEGTVTLDAGRYTVRFRTNERHDADGFDGPPPTRPEDWGIRIERADGVTANGDADD